MKKFIGILSVVILTPLSVFCQNTEKDIWIEIMQGDSVIVITLDKGRSIAHHLVEGDKNKERVEFLQNKVINLEMINDKDSLLIANLVQDSYKCDVQKHMYAQQNILLQKKIEIKTEENKKLKKKNWKYAGLGLLGGIILAALL